MKFASRVLGEFSYSQDLLAYFGIKIGKTVIRLAQSKTYLSNHPKLSNGHGCC